MAGPLVHPTSGFTRRQHYDSTRQTLTTERASFDAHYREMGDYYCPRRPRFTLEDRNRGDRRSQKIIDSAPRFAARTLASGLHAGLTSPARPWMKLTTPDPELSEFEPVKEWLHLVTHRMLDLFLKSNLYNALPILYGDLGVFGTAAMGVLEDGPDVMRCYTYPIGSYVVGLDERCMPSTFSREYQLTVEQVVAQFGRVDGTRAIDWSRLSQSVKNAWELQQYHAPVNVTWFLGVNDEQNPRGLAAAQTMPWRSCYYEQGRPSSDDHEGNGFLRESGFRTFPVLVPRWDVTGEDTYGTDSPGITALGDTKQLQLMQKHKGKAIAKAVDPTLVGPSHLKNQKVSLVPGGINYDDENRTGRGLRPVHEIRLEGLQFLIQDMGETRDRVRRAFYEDLFLMLAYSEYGARGGQPITAREVEERHEEKLLALGPVLERLNDELLDPLIDRTFSIMLAAGAVPEPPEELHGMDLKIEYVSIMQQAQKLIGVVGQDRFVSSATAMMEAFPSVRHKVNAFEVINSYADMLGVSPKILRSDKDAEALEAAEGQQAAAAAGAEQVQQLAQGAAALGKTPMQGGGSALDEVLGSAA
jgi:hypothetical protein